MSKRIHFLFVVVFLFSCQFSTQRLNNENDRDEADKVISTFYSLLSQNKIDEVYVLIHPGLLNANDPIKFKDFLTSISKQSPILKERKLDHWSTKVIMGLEASSIYALYYVNKYEGYELKISITLQKDSDDKIKIIGFQVNPEKFQN